ncbi:MAG: DUF2155 domain-containing protein [Holosporales bacterium]|jgi:hypothetical protein|nr:DUF2155 domain-containing protein [Holosporales bacterium]
MRIVTSIQHLMLVLLFWTGSLDRAHAQEKTVDAITVEEPRDRASPDRKALQQSTPQEENPVLDAADHFKVALPMPISTVGVQLLDKISCQRVHTTLQVGRLYAFGRLRILVLKAFKNPPEEYPEVYAFLEVWEIPLSHIDFGPKKGAHQEHTPPKETGTEETEEMLVFSGWMFASSPAIAPLEHPVYDVRLAQNAIRKRTRKLVPERQTSDIAPKRGG